LATSAALLGTTGQIASAQGVVAVPHDTIRQVDSSTVQVLSKVWCAVPARTAQPSLPAPLLIVNDSVVQPGLVTLRPCRGGTVPARVRSISFVRPQAATRIYGAAATGGALKVWLRPAIKQTDREEM
jgi:hypothetical protein